MIYWSKKLIGTHEELSDKLLSKRLEDVIPGEFAQTKTEKDTIESPFEKPEKVLMGKPVTLPLDKPVSVSMRKETLHPLDMPKETVNYKLEVANNEGLRVDRARAVTVGFVVRLDKFNEQVSGPHTPDSLYLPSEAGILNNRLYRTIYDNPELPADISESETLPGTTRRKMLWKKLLKFSKQSYLCVARRCRKVAKTVTKQEGNEHYA